MRSKVLRTACALLLLATSLSGCATRSVHFKSEPSGATVRVGAQQCLTPCTLALDCAASGATMVHLAQELPVDLPECSKLGNFGDQVLDKTGIALTGATCACLAVGLLGWTAINDDLDRNEDVSRGQLWFTAGSLAAAGVFALGAHGVGRLKEGSRGEARIVFDVAPPAAGVDYRPPAPPIPSAFGLKEEDLQRLFAPPGTAIP